MFSSQRTLNEKCCGAACNYNFDKCPNNTTYLKEKRELYNTREIKQKKKKTSEYASKFKKYRTIE